MLILQVSIQVKPECVDAFIAASRANAEGSRLEKGFVRFDVLQQEDDPTKFVFNEAWVDPQAHMAHRDTLHFIKWRDEVNPMMAVMRVVHKYRLISPTKL